MIQIVSAYLLKQKGTIDEGDGPSKTKIVDRRWLINMFRNYGQLAHEHFYVGLPDGGYWRFATLNRKWKSVDPPESDTTTIDGKMQADHYTTPEGIFSFAQCSNYVWVYAQDGEWSDNPMCFTDTFDSPFYQIMDSGYSVYYTFDVREDYSGREGSAEPYTHYWTASHVNYAKSSTSNHSDDGLFERDCTAHGISLNIGAPVFSSMEAGLAYCDAVTAYLQRMTEQNLQGISDALDASLNMP